jgi:hypothetical protein
MMWLIYIPTLFAVALAFKVLIVDCIIIAFYKGWTGKYPTSTTASRLS